MDALNNSEFILSKLEAAIASVKSIDLGDTLISGILGLVTVFLAVAAILPPSVLGFIRLMLLVASGTAVFILYWVVRRLIRSRKARLGILRKWQEEVFFAGTQVDLLERGKVRKMFDIIQLIEDARMSSTSRYAQLDIEFMNMLK